MVQTYRQTSSDWEQHQCFECNRNAHYWSQDAEGAPTWRANGRVVWHCQGHRDQGRAEAQSIYRRIWAG